MRNNTGFLFAPPSSLYRDNRYSADLMIISTLRDDMDYKPSPPRYKKFDRSKYNF
ncbi:MAG: hypothetical protein ACOX19_07985 [Fermentimonas sp.]|jgi:hypothetical protein